MESCPFKIEGGIVLSCATLDDSVRRTGNTVHRVGGAEMAPAAGLAICQFDNDEGYYLFYCDSVWRPLTDTYLDTVDDAKAQAEFEYANISLQWKSKA